MNNFTLLFCALCGAVATGILYGHWFARGIALYRSPLKGMLLTMVRLLSLAITIFCLLNLPGTRRILVMVFLAAAGSLSYGIVTRRP